MFHSYFHVILHLLPRPVSLSQCAASCSFALSSVVLLQTQQSSGFKAFHIYQSRCPDQVFFSPDLIRVL